VAAVAELYTLGDMNDITEKTRLLAKKKQLKLLMAMMLAFMVLSPLLGPKIFAEDFSKLKGAGLYIFYIGSPTIFGALFAFYLILYRRTERKMGGRQ